MKTVPNEHLDDHQEQEYERHLQTYDKPLSQKDAHICDRSPVSALTWPEWFDTLERRDIRISLDDYTSYRMSYCQKL